MHTLTGTYHIIRINELPMMINVLPGDAFSCAHNRRPQIAAQLTIQTSLVTVISQPRIPQLASTHVKDKPLYVVDHIFSPRVTKFPRILGQRHVKDQAGARCGSRVANWRRG